MLYSAFLNYNEAKKLTLMSNLKFVFGKRITRQASGLEQGVEGVDNRHLILYNTTNTNDKKVKGISFSLQHLVRIE